MEILGQSLILTLALVIMIVGLVGTVVPAVPGLILIWVGVLFYVLVEGFGKLEPLTFIGLTALTILGIGLNAWLGPAQARASGASYWSVAAGMAGGLLGTFLIPIPLVGTVIGALLAVIGAEWVRLRDWRQAARVGGGWLKGWLLSVLIEAGVGLIMIALFAWRATALLGK